MASVMLDLETLATSHNPVVLTLGATKFNPFTLQEPFEDLYLKLDVDDQMARGRDVSEDTLEWWGKQSAEIQNEALGADKQHPHRDIEIPHFEGGPDEGEIGMDAGEGARKR